jgi:hypothetical protein
MRIDQDRNDPSQDAERRPVPAARRTAMTVTRIVVSPRMAIRHLSQEGDVRGGVLVAGTTWGAVGMTAFGSSLTGDGVDMGPATVGVTVAGGALTGSVGIMMALLVTLLVHLSAHAVGGKGRFDSMYAVVGYASIAAAPLVPALIVTDFVGQGIGSAIKDVTVAISLVWWSAIVASAIRGVYRTPWRAVPGALVLALIGGAFASVALLTVLFFIGLLVVMVVVP